MAAIDQALINFEKEKERFAEIIEACPLNTVERSTLKEAIAYSREKRQPRCELLDDAVKTLLASGNIATEHYSVIVLYFTRVRDAILARDNYLSEQGIQKYAATPLLSELMVDHTNLERCKVWIEALATGEVTIDVHLEAILKEKIKRERLAEERLQAKLKRLLDAKTEDERNREIYCYYKSIQYCASPSCESRASKYCSQTRCPKCCEGPCVLHCKLPKSIIRAEEELTPEEQVVIKDEQVESEM